MVSPSEIPVHRIDIDIDEFAQLSPGERTGFLLFVTRLAHLGYFSHHETPERAWAYLDLATHSSFENYIAQCRKVLKGNAVRDALKAERKGYYSKFFNEVTFRPDVVAIDTSTEVRQGMPMTPYRMNSVEERGGYPQRFEAETPPTQSFHWLRHFGVFRDLPGHRQGDIIVDEQLLGYITLRRCANFASYTTIFGHAGHLSDGIVYKMHLDLIRLLMKSRQPCAAASEDADAPCCNLRYIFYGVYFSTSKGLEMWKRKMLFKPGYFQLNYEDCAKRDPDTARIVAKVLASQHRPS
jgi:hypothetical protein